MQSHTAGEPAEMFASGICTVKAILTGLLEGSGN